MAKFIPQGLGWLPDLPDPRDYTYGQKDVLQILRNLHPKNSGEIRDEVDLRYGDEGEEFFLDVEDQGHINSSAAFAVLSLVEYFERRIHGRTFDGSKLFLYKVTRNLRNKQHLVPGDTGADLRSTLKALRHFGLPEEEHWPYSPSRVDDEPSTFVYQVAKPLNHLRYFRVQNPIEKRHHDPPMTRWDLLTCFLDAGFPIAFGFSVPSSLSAHSNIPFRPALDEIRGGLAALIIGYKFHFYGRNQHALLVRTSWGKEWGDNGNGWLPAGYVHQKLARDFWTIACDGWIESTELTRPACTE